MDNNSFHTGQSILLQPEPCLMGPAYPFSLAPASSSSKAPPSLQPPWMVGPSHYRASVSEGIAYLSEHLADPSHGMDSSDSVEGLMSLVFLSIHAFSHNQHSRDLPQLSSGLWVFGKSCHQSRPLSSLPHGDRKDSSDGWLLSFSLSLSFSSSCLLPPDNTCFHVDLPFLSSPRAGKQYLGQ